MNVNESPARRLIAILTLVDAYFIAGTLGLRLAFVNESASAVWAPTGIAIAALVIFGRGLWPGIWLGAFLTNITTAGSIWTTLGIATGNTLEALLAAWLVGRFAYGRKAFEQPTRVFVFVVLAALLSTMVSATIGVTSLALGGYAPWSNYSAIWLTWWLGDAGGALIVAPFLILWANQPRVRWTPLQTLEAATLFLAVVVVGSIVFGDVAGFVQQDNPFAFLCIPLFVWAAFRFGQRETATAVLLLALMAIAGTLHGFGPFVRASPNQSLLLLQAFLGVSAVMALALAAVVAERMDAAVALRQSEERFRQIAESIKEIFYVVDLQTRQLLYVSPAYFSVWGRTCESLYKDPASFMEAIPTEHRSRVVQAMEKHLLGEITEEEYPIMRPDGNTRWIRDRAFPLLDQTGKAYRVTGIAEDVTDRRSIHQVLRDSLARMRAIIDSAHDGIINLDLQDRILEFNPAAERIFGYSRSEVLGKRMAELFLPPFGRERHWKGLAHYLATGEGGWLGQWIESTAFRKDGSACAIELAMTPVTLEQPAFTCLVRDISERKRNQERIQASLEEKEVLLKEINHRVKNNLQVVSSLLHLQSASIRDPVARGLFVEGENRIKCMALIHETLYHSNNLARINFAEYAGKLAADLFDSFGSNDGVVTLRINFPEVQLNLDTAIPCGLIINELVSNALKHAFPGGRKGEVELILNVDEKGVYHLIVRDNGTGLPQNLDFRKTRTLGMQLVTNLTNQLNGKIEHSRNGGTEFAITFSDQNKNQN